MEKVSEKQIPTAFMLPPAVKAHIFSMAQKANTTASRLIRRVVLDWYERADRDAA